MRCMIFCLSGVVVGIFIIICYDIRNHSYYICQLNFVMQFAFALLLSISFYLLGFPAVRDVIRKMQSALRVRVIEMGESGLTNKLTLSSLPVNDSPFTNSAVATHRRKHKITDRLAELPKEQTNERTDEMMTK